MWPFKKKEQDVVHVAVTKLSVLRIQPNDIIVWHVASWEFPDDATRAEIGKKLADAIKVPFALWFIGADDEIKILRPEPTPTEVLPE
jgi:hypothetical protein